MTPTHYSEITKVLNPHQDTEYLYLADDEAFPTFEDAKAFFEALEVTEGWYK